jgi:predicted transglutaminase-like cysteine proteinase
MVSTYRKEPVAPSSSACFLRLLVAASLGIASSAAAGASNEAAAPSGGPAIAPQNARWILPPSNLTRRAAVLGGQSSMEQTLKNQGSAMVAEPAVFTDFAARSPAPVSRRYAASREPAADTPNVFGSVALAVSRTPLDAQWQRATASRPAHRLNAWTRAFPRSHDRNREALLRQVNQWVNDRIQFTDDLRLAGQADRWASAAESLQRRRGDCEDYALAKMQLLDALGFESDRMYLVLVRDLVRRADHAVLVIQLDDRFVVLDNMTDEVIDSADIRDYRPVISYSAAGRWVHGYPTEPARQPIQIAANIGSYAP